LHIASSVFYRKPIQQGAWFLVDKKSQICLWKLCSMAANCVKSSVSSSLRAKRTVCAFMLESPVLDAGFQRFLPDKQQLLSSGMVIRLSVTVFTQNASQGYTHHMDIYAGDDSMSDGRECLNRTGGTTRHNTVIKIAEVSYQTGLSRATIYREIKAGNFPKQLQLSPQRVGWLQCEIDAWRSARRRGPVVKSEVQQRKALNNNDQPQFPKLVSA